MAPKKPRFSKTELEVLEAVYALETQGVIQPGNEGIAEWINKSKSDPKDFITPETVRTHRTNIYRKMGITDLPQAEKAPILSQSLKEWKKEETSAKTTGRRVPTWGLVLFIMVGIVLSYLYYRPKTAAPTATSTLMLTGTIQPTLKPTEGQGAIPVAFTDTSTFTPVPPTLTETFTPTFTPTSSPTPLLATPFVTDFSQGLPSWTIENCPTLPTISNNALIPAQSCWVSVGDNSWTNYKVTIQFKKTAPFGYDNTVIQIRSTDLGNGVRFYQYENKMFGATLKDGNESRLQGSDVGTGTTVTIEVRGNHFLFEGKDIQIFDYPNGRVILGLSSYTEIEKIEVVPLP